MVPLGPGTMIQFVLTLLIGSVIGLAIVPLLPESAQIRVIKWQSDVSNTVDWIVDASDSTGTTDKIASIGESIKDEVSTIAIGPTIQATDMESIVHLRVNRERSNFGLLELRQDDSLSAIARSHSQNIATLQYFDHEDRFGRGPTERGDLQGYSCRKDYGSYYTDGIAENIFQNWLFESTTFVGPVPIKDYSSVEEIAESTVIGWMNSAGHRENILKSGYDRVGTGVAVAEDGKVYITQNFC
jgi:uncharacterized protein YkwD